MENALQTFLEETGARLLDRAFAIVSPETASPATWRLLWSSCASVGDRYGGPLAPYPEPVDWPGASRAMGLALRSKLRPLGVIVWPRDRESDSEGMLEILEACRELYWQESERRWTGILHSTLAALKEQRRQVGTALHRGPAQALTAARLELSMQSPGARDGSVAQAIEQASEELVALVHGKLRGRSHGDTLAAIVRGELDFQARWRELPVGTDSITLPADDLSLALAELWRLAGGQVQQDGESSIFVLKGAS